jgi:hypothetical protein
VARASICDAWTKKARSDALGNWGFGACFGPLRLTGSPAEIQPGCFVDGVIEHPRDHFPSDAQQSPAAPEAHGTRRHGNQQLPRRDESPLAKNGAQAVGGP